VIDSLLAQLNPSSHTVSPDFSQGFADDVVTAVKGEDLPTLISKMQHIVKVKHDWCLENDLTLSPLKTSLVLFTRKRNFSIDTPIYVGNQPLSYSSDVRYLGAILDQKLNWTKHIDAVTKKAERNGVTLLVPQNRSSIQLSYLR
jgi:hypothetical protein